MSAHDIQDLHAKGPRHLAHVRNWYLPKINRANLAYLGYKVRHLTFFANVGFVLQLNHAAQHNESVALMASMSMAFTPIAIAPPNLLPSNKRDAASFLWHALLD